MENAKFKVYIVISLSIILIGSYILIKETGVLSKDKVYDCSISVMIKRYTENGVKLFPPEDVRTNDTLVIYMNGIPSDLNINWIINGMENDYYLDFIGKKITTQFFQSSNYIIQGSPYPFGKQWVEYDLIVKNTDASYYIDEGETYSYPIRNLYHDCSVTAQIEPGITIPEIELHMELNNIVGNYEIRYYFMELNGDLDFLDREDLKSTGGKHTIMRSFEGKSTSEKHDYEVYSFMVEIIPQQGSCEGGEIQIDIIY